MPQELADDCPCPQPFKDAAYCDDCPYRAAMTARMVRERLLAKARACRRTHDEHYAPLGVTHTVYLDYARAYRDAAEMLRGVSS